jgi:hypothetical protein
MKYLIPLSYLTEACALSQNIDEKAFKIHVKFAQEELSDVLGKEFYNQIYTQYDANTNTFSAENLTLYEDYIKDYLAWTTYLAYLGFSQSASTPTGEREFIDENSTILKDLSLYSKEKNIRARSIRYKYRMLNFLRISQDNAIKAGTTAYALYTGDCKQQMSFAISSVSKTNDELIQVNKAIRTNE